MKVDQVLVREVQALADEENSHAIAEAVNAYTMACHGFNETGEPSFRLLTEEGHTNLRILRTGLRMKRLALAA